MDLTSPFLIRLREGITRLNPQKRGLLLAVSGGADSMAMLHGVRSLCRELSIERIAVGHLNHSLRGAESELDAALVQQCCSEGDVQLISKSLSPGLLASQSAGSLEASARAARYEFLHQTALAYNIPLIATAHHQQDQVETVLFSLLRGTGLRGLSGMPDSRTLCPQVRIIRPLLQTDPLDIRRYLEANRIPFREDVTNATAEFARNRIRMTLKLLPTADRQKFSSHLLKLSQQAAATMTSVDLVAEAILAQCVLDASPFSLQLDRRLIMKWPEPLVRHALILQWIRQQWPRQQMNTTHWERLSSAVQHGTPRRWSFPGRVTMTIRRMIVSLEMQIAETSATDPANQK